MKKRTAWIIGTGPSLRNVDVSKLKGQHTMTFNRAYVAFDDWGFDPTYYLCIDATDLRAMYKDINNLIVNSNIKAFFLPKLFDNLEHPPECFQDGDKKENLFIDSKKLFTVVEDLKPGMPRDEVPVANLYNEGTHIDTKNRQVTTFHDPNGGIMGLKILKALGYNEIAFVGCDARYADNDESNKYITKMGNEYVSHENYDVNHFRDDYFGKGMRFGKPNQDWIIALWYVASKQINEHFPHFNVYSCTENSNLNKFYPYIPYEDFLNGKR